jgi:Family of unknown function (DUF5343)
MSNAEKDAELKRLAPPYVGYASFKNMVGGFKEHVLPSRIDRSVLGNFSGLLQGQLLNTLRFLQLIDSEDRPQQPLQQLVEAANGTAWPTALGAVLQSAYAPIFKLDLKSASPSQFSESFAKTYPGEGSTLRKSMTFFLTASQDAKLPISPYILKNKKPRSGPAKKRTTPSQNGTPKPEHKNNTNTDPPTVQRKLSEQVLAVLDSDNLEKEVESAVFVLLKHLRKEGK